MPKATGLKKKRMIDVEESNMALVGSDLDKKVKLAASLDEPAWNNVGERIEPAHGLSKPGLQIWRIEKFHVVAWPTQEYGKFFDQDSYIILYTYKKEDKFLYNIHFWIGCGSTQDEYGTAAYKTVELDTRLGGIPVQYREVQDSESQLFHSYFSNVFIMEGGIESGFNRVDPVEYRPRMLHIKKAKTHVYVREVPCKASSLNSGDCFIYDAGMNLYQFNGKQSAGKERCKAAQVARMFDAERSGKPEVHVFEEGDGGSAEGIFWESMGGKKAISAATPDDGPIPERTKRLYRLSDASGKLRFKEVTCSHSSLVSSDVFIYDSGTIVYVWVGRKSSDAERANAMGFATRYLADNQIPMSTQCVSMSESAPCEHFKKSLVLTSAAA